MAVKLESSLTDMMTSLAVVFIMLMLALVNSIGNAGKNDLKVIQQEIKKALESQQLECKNNERRGDPLSCTITLPHDKLQFVSGMHTVDISGKRFLREIFPKLMNILVRDDIKTNVEGIYIEGFTDDIGDDNFNLFLSQNRAFEVGSFLISRVFTEENIQRKSLLRWLYLNGRGEQDLQFLDDSRKVVARDLSRRVEVTIRVKSLQQQVALKKQMESDAKT